MTWASDPPSSDGAPGSFFRTDVPRTTSISSSTPPHPKFCGLSVGLMPSRSLSRVAHASLITAAQKHKCPGRGCCPRGTVDRSGESRGLRLLQDTRSKTLGQVGTCCEPGLSPRRTADHPARHLVTRATLGHLPGPAEPRSSATTSGDRTRHLARRRVEAERGGGPRGNSGL